METTNISNDPYKDIRPLNESEIPEAFAQLLQDETLRSLIPVMLPGYTVKDLEMLQPQIRTIYDFKKHISLPVVSEISKKSCFSISSSGMSKIENDKAYTFITNHRDIVLDASFLSVLLFQNGKLFPQIAIGDNLLIKEWIRQLVRINNSFIVKRAVSVREMLTESKKLSSYIRHTITDTDESVWIAQREGRAKDSNDRTQTAMLKMLAMSSDKEPDTALQELRIVPVSLSYEYDPCDYLKAQEMLQKKLDPEHKKSQMDDLKNMQQGIVGKKGRVHLSICEPMGDFTTGLPAKEALQAWAEEIDRRIHKKYRLYEINYIAYDLLHGTKKYLGSMYGEKDLAEIEQYFAEQIGKIEIPGDAKDETFLRERILEMYANPLINNLNA
ncbi:MAG: acyltransferase [Porphyromonas sp.]|nr:acyltransferase [Porphyromonas sp.]